MLSIPRIGGTNGYTAGWQPTENQAITRLYPTAPRAELLAALPGRSWNAIGLQAGALGVKRKPYWNPERLATLRRHYPAHGAPYVAALLGCASGKVTKQASLQGIARVFAPKPTPTPKPPKPVKPTPAPKPQPKPVVEAVAQHQPARLSNLINQKSKRKKGKGDLVHASITVAQVKQLPLAHPGRRAYEFDGVRGYENWLKGQAA